MIKRYIKKSWGVNLILIRLAIGLALQKIVAIKYGPVGTTLLNHFQNFIALFTQPLQDIVGQGLVNGIRKEKYKENEILGAALIFSSIIFLFIGSLTTIFQQTTVNQLAFLHSQWPLILLSILLLCIQILLMNYLVARAALRALFFLSFIPGTLILLTLYLASASIEQTLTIYIGLQALTTLIYFAYIFISYPKYFQIKGKLNKEISKHFLNFVAIGLSIWLCSKLTDFYVRSFAMVNFNEQDTGNWQAVARISEAYKGIFISYLMISLFPLLSGLKSSAELIKKFKPYTRNYFLIISGFIVVLLFLKNDLLSLLYDDSYQLSATLFNIQIIGDLLALLSFPFSILMLSKLNTRNYILAEVIGTLCYLLAIYLLPFDTFSILFFAYFFRYLIYLTLVIIFTRRYWISA